MSSLARYASSAVKVPAGRTFLAQPDQQFLSCLNFQPYCFQQSDIDSLVSSGFKKVSDSLYIAQTRVDLDSVLNSLNNLTDYQFVTAEYTAVDLGKTIRIGVAGGDNDVITMRLVKRTGNVQSAGGPNHFPNVCYIVTGNKTAKTYNDALMCKVLGTLPNNRSKKPFLNNGGYQPCVISAATLDTIFASAVKVSECLYLARTTSDFENVLDTISGSDNYVVMSAYELSSIDLGKTIRLGIVGGDNDLLVFRLIKRTGNVASGGGPRFDSQNVGYICIASKVNQSEYQGATEPLATGSTPNSLEVKPQIMSNGGYEPTLFSEAELLTILGSDCIKISNSFYLARDAEQLASVCGQLNNPTGRDYFPNGDFGLYVYSSVDLGKTIRLGLVGGENDLITFASTKGQSALGIAGQLTAGYVVVANKLSQDYNAALYVSILGSAPRDS